VTTTTRNRLRARLGAGLIAGSMALAVLAIPGGGAAQEEPEPQPVEVSKDAVYIRSSGEAAPNTLTSEFPPGVICLVVADQFPGGGALCGEETAPVLDPVNEQLTETDPENTPDDQSPQQVRAPNTITVAQNSGEQRYAGGIEFAVPAVAEDQDLVSALLVFNETEPTYHTSSPFFRQMMLAALAGVRDRDAAQDEATKAIMNEGGQYPPADREVGDVGVEVCPFTEPFEDGSNLWEDTPSFDCIFGANGERIETEDGWEWHFDLTFTLMAWQDGTLENHGLYVRATQAPNLAFGDPDTSWQAQISFGSAGSGIPPEIALVTTAASTPSVFVPPPSQDTSSSGSGSQGTVFPAPRAFPGTQGPAPTVSGGQPGPAVAPQQPVAQPAAQPVLASSPVTPWWVWLLVPTFLFGMFMVSQSLTAQAGSTVVREGAMTRLIRQRNTGELATGTPQFQV